MSYRTRILETTIRKAAKFFPSILVTGPRQSGKTTLLKKAFARTHRFLSLENPDLRSRALADPVGFLKTHHPPVILDEIQYAPLLLSYVKSEIDEDRTPGRWIMSGSQGFPIMQNVSQSLAGRVAVFSLLPFSYDEWAGDPKGKVAVDRIIKAIFRGGRSSPPRRLKRKGRDPAAWLLRGGYPEPSLAPGMPMSQWCAGYVQTYLERDVRSLVQVGDLNAFERFLQLCAARTAQVLNLSQLARDTGIAVPTAKRWLSVLEASYIVFLVPPFFRNIGKRLIKAHKLYFLDTGLAAYLTGFRSTETLRLGPMQGPLFETAVASSWYKLFAHRGEKPSLFYWRTWDGFEVDLIVEWDGKLYPVEVKSTSSPRPEQAASIRRWIREVGGEPGVIVADVEDAMPVSPGIRAVPWHWV